MPESTAAAWGGTLPRHPWQLLFLLLIFVASAACADDRSSTAKACDVLQKMAGNAGDAAPIIANCLSQLPPGAVLNLAPGRYRLQTPIAITRSVTIRSKSDSGPRICQRQGNTDCAVLVIDQMAPQPQSGIMPVEIRAANVRLQSIAIVGSANRSSEWEKRTCLDEGVRPLGGGIRVRGSDFRMEYVLLRDFSCHTALEIVPQALRPVIIGNLIGPNGRHHGQMWSDGLTIHDTVSALIKNNTFIDNTDVQLIFGGCRNCRIIANEFRHSSASDYSAFAELMLHSWPNTSGDFTGSITSKNDIDCSTLRRCGFGIMIGGEPWYTANTFGGLVRDNRITNALLGINIDKLTGPMAVKSNKIKDSGGFYFSTCGGRTWPAFNISPESMRFIHTDNDKHASMDTKKCLLLRLENP